MSKERRCYNCYRNDPEVKLIVDCIGRVVCRFCEYPEYVLNGNSTKRRISQDFDDVQGEEIMEFMGVWPF